MAGSTDDFDWEIIAFVVRWAPYGEPDAEEVMPAFGMTYHQLQKRFAAVVTSLMTNDSVRLTRRQHELLRRAAQLLPPQRHSTVRAARRG